MDLARPKGYLIRSGEAISYYFYLNNNCLNYNSYSDKNILIKNQVLLCNLVDFSASLDKEGRIHVVCLTGSGDLLYYLYEGNKWTSRTICKFNTKSNIYKYLSLYISDEFSHIIYTRTNILTSSLSTIEHIYWDRQGINRLIVTTYVHGEYSCPLQISFDSLNNIHIVYKVFHKDNHQLYYCKFNILTRSWTSGDLITNLEEDHCHPYIFIDSRDNLHLAWSTVEGSNFILKYKNKPRLIASRSNWSGIQLLSSKNSNNLAPIIIEESDLLKIYCKQNDQVLEILSKDLGLSWEAYDKSKAYFIKNPSLIRYLNGSDKDFYRAKHVYGHIANTIKLIGINIFNEEIIFNGEIDQVNQDKKIEEDDNLSLDLIQAIDEKIDRLILQVNEYEAASNEDIGLLNDIVYSYSLMEDELARIEEDKEGLTDLLNEYDFNLRLLDERLASLGDEILALEKKLVRLGENTGLFSRLLKFFKW